MKGNEEFGAINASYVFQTLNDSILPTKGISFKIGGDYTDNIGRSPPILKLMPFVGKIESFNV